MEQPGWKSRLALLKKHKQQAGHRTPPRDDVEPDAWTSYAKSLSQDEFGDALGRVGAAARDYDDATPKFQLKSHCTPPRPAQSAARRHSTTPLPRMLEFGDAMGDGDDDSPPRTHEEGESDEDVPVVEGPGLPMLVAADQVVDARVSVVAETPVLSPLARHADADAGTADDVRGSHAQLGHALRGRRLDFSSSSTDELLVVNRLDIEEGIRRSRAGLDVPAVVLADVPAAEVPAVVPADVQPAVVQPTAVQPQPHAYDYDYDETFESEEEGEDGDDGDDGRWAHPTPERIRMQERMQAQAAAEQPQDEELAHDEPQDHADWVQPSPGARWESESDGGDSESTEIAEQELEEPEDEEPQDEEEDAEPQEWREAFDNDGRLYYYHRGTRETQWEPPLAPGAFVSNASAATPASVPRSAPGKPASKTTPAALAGAALPGYRTEPRGGAAAAAAVAALPALPEHRAQQKFEAMLESAARDFDEDRVAAPSVFCPYCGHRGPSPQLADHLRGCAASKRAEGSPVHRDVANALRLVLGSELAAAPQAQGQQREECPDCGRLFAAGRLEPHAKACRRVFLERRPEFDGRAARLRGTPAEHVFARTAPAEPAPAPEPEQQPAPAPTPGRRNFADKKRECPSCGAFEAPTREALLEHLRGCLVNSPARAPAAAVPSSAAPAAAAAAAAPADETTPAQTRPRPQQRRTTGPLSSCRFCGRDVQRARISAHLLKCKELKKSRQKVCKPVRP